jgi:hypothetical protein
MIAVLGGLRVASAWAVPRPLPRSSGPRRGSGARRARPSRSWSRATTAAALRLFPARHRGRRVPDKRVPFCHIAAQREGHRAGCGSNDRRNRSSVLRSGRHYRPRRRQSTQATRPSLQSTSRSPPSDLQHWQSRPYPILENSRPRPQSPHLYVALNEVANDLLLCGGAQSRPRDSDDSKTPLRSAGDVQGNFVANDGTQEGLSKWGRL